MSSEPNTSESERVSESWQYGGVKMSHVWQACHLPPASTESADPGRIRSLPPTTSPLFSRMRLPSVRPRNVGQQIGRWTPLGSAVSPEPLPYRVHGRGSKGGWKWAFSSSSERYTANSSALHAVDKLQSLHLIEQPIDGICSSEPSRLRPPVSSPRTVAASVRLRRRAGILSNRQSGNFTQAVRASPKNVSDALAADWLLERCGLRRHATCPDISSNRIVCRRGDGG
jgi:hypothetical protein